jgi:hypothetical protein
MENQTSDVEVLRSEIKAAREAALKEAESTPGPQSAIEKDKDKDKDPEDRFTRRLQKRKVSQLDYLVGTFMRFRALQEDPDGEVSAVRYDELKAVWFRKCDGHNSKVKYKKGEIQSKKARVFRLRYEAFADQVEYLLFLEKEQIIAAKEAFRKRKFEEYWKRNKSLYKYKRLIWWVKAVLAFKPQKRQGFAYQWYCKNIYKAPVE